jgi:hypothetical protein
LRGEEWWVQCSCAAVDDEVGDEEKEEWKGKEGTNESVHLTHRESAKQSPHQWSFGTADTAKREWRASQPASDLSHCTE